LLFSIISMEEKVADMFITLVPIHLNALPNRPDS
jgi:hypothetical protein